MQSFPGTFNINLICYISIRHQEHLKKKSSIHWITNPCFKRWKFLCTGNIFSPWPVQEQTVVSGMEKKKKKCIRAMPKVFVPWIRDSICKTQFYVSGICSNASSTRHQQEELKLSYLGCHHSYHISKPIRKEFLHETGTINSILSSLNVPQSSDLRISKSSIIAMSFTDHEPSMFQQIWRWIIN